MTITRIGTNAKYADGWDKAFGGKSASSAKKSTDQGAAKGKPSKKASPKKAAKKGKK